MRLGNNENNALAKPFTVIKSIQRLKETERKIRQKWIRAIVRIDKNRQNGLGL